MAGKLTPRTRRVAAEIGALVRAAREAAGLSQEELAREIGMTRPNYARIEQGKTIGEGLDLDLHVCGTSLLEERCAWMMAA